MPLDVLRHKLARRVLGRILDAEDREHGTSKSTITGELVTGGEIHRYRHRRSIRGSTLQLGSHGRAAAARVNALEPVSCQQTGEDCDLLNSSHIEFMAFPRLASLAELAWSPFSTHNFDAFKQRLAAQGPRWQTLGINFYRSPQIPWPS